MLAVFDHEKDQASLITTARALHHDLNSGRRRISAATHQYFDQEVRQYLTEAEPQTAPRVGIAEGVE